jgi:phosphate starvation-inducible PhoH-like protein
MQRRAAQSRRGGAVPCSTSTSKADEPLSVDDIQLGLIEVAIAGRGKAPAEPALQTRKSELHGRTPRQVEYLRQIQEHDITFGIGPAGTGKTYLAVASAVDAFERDQVSASC